MISLIDKLNSVCANVSLSLPIPSDKPTHNLVPGQQVLIQSLKPVAVGEPRYLGPAVVIAVTRTGVLTDHQPFSRGKISSNEFRLTSLPCRRKVPLV